MRALIQRVTRAGVTVDGEVIGRIGHGLLVLAGIAGSDTQAELDLVASKLVNLRIFEDEDGRMNRSLLEVMADRPDEAGLLLVSQFTLYADMRKGRRPSFVGAAAPDQAAPMIEAFAQTLELHGCRVEQGRFGAEMAVELVNDGPVTIMLDSDDLKRPRRGAERHNESG